MALPAGAVLGAFIDAFLGRPTCPPSCSCWDSYNAERRAMVEALPAYGHGSQPAPSPSAPNTEEVPSSTVGGPNEIEEVEEDVMPGLVGECACLVSMNSPRGR